MQVLYVNGEAVPEVEAALGARQVALDDLLAGSDFVCVVLPLTGADGTHDGAARIRADAPRRHLHQRFARGASSTR